MVELDSESSLVTKQWVNKSFSYSPYTVEKYSPWLRLSFALKVSSDVFEERLNSVMQGVKGITGCVDDVSARSVDSKDHYMNMFRLLKTAIKVLCEQTRELTHFLDCLMLSGLGNFVVDCHI